MGLLIQTINSCTYSVLMFPQLTWHLKIQHTVSFVVKLKEYCAKTYNEYELVYTSLYNLIHTSPNKYIIASLKAHQACAVNTSR